MDTTNAYMDIIKGNIEYDHHMQYDDYNNKDMFQELYEVICEVVCVPRKTIKVDKLKENPLIRKCKLLHLPGNKYNKLNLYLLQKKFTERELPPLLLGIADKSKSELRNITTYKKLENTLKHDKRVI